MIQVRKKENIKYHTWRGTPYGKVTKAQENNTHKRANRSAPSQQVLTICVNLFRIWASGVWGDVVYRKGFVNYAQDITHYTGLMMDAENRTKTDHSTSLNLWLRWDKKGYYDLNMWYSQIQGVMKERH